MNLKNNQIIYDIIKNTEFSEYLNDNTIVELSKIMNLVEYEKDTVIYSKNEEITKFLIINNGQCKLINNNSIIRELNNNDFFGLISLLTNSSKNYDLIATKKTPRPPR